MMVGNIIPGGNWRKHLSWMCMTSVLQRRIAEENIPAAETAGTNLLSQEALKIRTPGNLMWGQLYRENFVMTRTIYKSIN
ncbi:hypothetical protein EMIT091MI3_150099 [Kosakonia quasisacchari]